MYLNTRQDKNVDRAPLRRICKCITCLDTSVVAILEPRKSSKDYTESRKHDNGSEKPEDVHRRL